MFTHLVGRRAQELNTVLTHGGFRRSQTIAYRPACEGCRACISVRVVVNDFVLSRNMHKVLKINNDLVGEMKANKPTSEHYSLFRSYLDARHGEGGMADMTVLDFAMMVEDSHVETRAVEYRKRQEEGKAPNPLIGVCLSDVLGDGLSMVYSFFEASEAQRSLGTLMILDHIARAKALGLTYLYLGYWVEASQKMNYKGRFKPQERLTTEGWMRVER